MSQRYDILIIGGGLSGLCAALAGASAGLSVAVIDGRDIAQIPNDGRASALAASSMRMLTRLGVNILEQVQPFHDMLITEGLSSSPWRLHFDSRDHGEPTAFMIENPLLYAALLRQAQYSANIDLLSPRRVRSWDFNITSAAVTLDDGKRLSADLLIAADGRNSPSRKAAQISVNSKAYEQSALVTTIAHSLPHEGLALQRFLPGGPLAVLPLLGQKCQIVWSDGTTAIQAAMSLDEPSFTALLSERIGDYLGEISLAAPRQSYPLSLQIASRFTAMRMALIGDAAHVIHPLAGQGLNLGLRDVAALMDGVSEARSNGQDIGVAGLQSYELWRTSETRLMGGMTDGLSMLFGTKSRLLGHVRRSGLAALNAFAPAKKILMQEAAGESAELPILMRR